MRQALRILVVAMLIALVAAAVLTVHGDAPKTEMIQIPGAKEPLSGFLATPEKPGHYPALVVIHEWWGLTDWVKGETEKLAEQGYVALAVDLYRGKVTSDPEEAHELMRGLPDDRALADLKAGFDYLSARKDVDHGRIGSIGWCMGGGYSLQLAIHEPRLAACVVNYGALPTDPQELQLIGAPILGNFGALDRGITPADVHAFEKTMNGLGKRVDVKIYDGAGHAFENSTNATGYRPEAAADAWSRSVAFLNKSLK
ncbi:MAG TPA: dienelactone hydrolase family protein [Candidatus Baltobacteraceae bacterium]|nr:dienelactone hydrolase family protein [Candidatus Baltobacteraceae bacterium]